MNKKLKIVISILLFTLLLYLYNYNFLVFHSIVELFSIIIAFNIFIISWNSRNFTNNKMLLLFGVAYLAVGFMDVLHMLTFEGVEIFADPGVGVTTQFWIGARYLEGISFLVVAIFSLKNKKVKTESILGIYLVITGILILTILKNDIFPICYIPGVGLTPFKIYSEYLISLMFVLAGIIFWKYKEKINLNQKALYFLLLSLSMTVISEICFSLYIQIVCYYQFFGHIFKLFSFYLIYKVLIEESLKKPYSNLFKDYNNTQKKLIATGSMMSTMLHDIKNPLTNIRAISQIGNKTAGSIKAEGYFAKIIQHVDNITGMINKINHAFDSDNIKEVNPANPLEEVFMEVQTLCHSNNIKIKINLNEVVSKVLLEENLFKRVIYNIVNNAVQVLDENGTIKINMEELKENVIISISDNGPGIPPEIQDDIFKPYISKSGGTGLGLYMVDFAVSDLFGGKVWFESEQDKGTTFFIELPKV